MKGVGVSGHPQAAGGLHPGPSIWSASNLGEKRENASKDGMIDADLGKLAIDKEATMPKNSFKIDNA